MFAEGIAKDNVIEIVKQVEIGIASQSSCSGVLAAELARSVAMVWLGDRTSDLIGGRWLYHSCSISHV